MIAVIEGGSLFLSKHAKSFSRLLILGNQNVFVRGQDIFFLLVMSQGRILSINFILF